MKFLKVVRSQDKKVQTGTAVLAVHIGTSTTFLSSILSMKLYGRYSTQSLTIRSPIATIVTLYFNMKENAVWQFYWLFP